MTSEVEQLLADAKADVDRWGGVQRYMALLNSIVQQSISAADLAEKFLSATWARRDPKCVALTLLGHKRRIESVVEMLILEVYLASKTTPENPDASGSKNNRH